MKIYLATDHRGFELKEKIKKWLTEWGYEFEDMGAYEYNADDDYPDFIFKAAQKVSENPENSKAIILGGSGQGEAMAANRLKGVRAAVFYGPPLEFRYLSLIKRFIWFNANTGFFFIGREIIKLSREHNNSNILSLGASFLSLSWNDGILVKKLIKLWLETPFSGEDRHERRIKKIDK